MQGDAISSGFARISRRFSAGLVGLSQGKSTPKCRQRRRNCTSGILETHSNPLFYIQRINFTYLYTDAIVSLAVACGLSPDLFIEMMAGTANHRVCFKMQGDAVSSGFACISAGLLAASQGKSTQKCRQRRRKCTSCILETHSRPGEVLSWELQVKMAILLCAIAMIWASRSG